MASSIARISDHGPVIMSDMSAAPYASPVPRHQLPPGPSLLPACRWPSCRWWRAHDASAPTPPATARLCSRRPIGCSSATDPSGITMDGGRVRGRRGQGHAVPALRRSREPVPRADRRPRARLSGGLHPGPAAARTRSPAADRLTAFGHAMFGLIEEHGALLVESTPGDPGAPIRPPRLHHLPDPLVALLDRAIGEQRAPYLAGVLLARAGPRTRHVPAPGRSACQRTSSSTAGRS